MKSHLVLIAAGLLFLPQIADAQSSGQKLDLALCSGPYALCAASTCKLTGNNYPGTSFPEVKCECPVLKGLSIADLSGGNMQGSCAPPADGVWSLYSLRSSFPQKIHGVWQRDVAATPHNCPAMSTDQEPKRNLYGQCFSYSCKNVRTVHGIPIADCYCPALTVVDPERTFATQAGECRESVCSQIPVGGPFKAPDDLCKKK